MYRSRDASSDDMIGEVCVRNSCSRLRNKVSCIFFGETLTIRYDVICTVVLVADVDWQLICLSSPACCHRSLRYIYEGMVGICLLTSCHVLRQISGLHHAPKICTDRRPGKSLKVKKESARGHKSFYPLSVTSNCCSQPKIEDFLLWLVQSPMRSESPRLNRNSSFPMGSSFLIGVFIKFFLIAIIVLESYM